MNIEKCTRSCTRKAEAMSESAEMLMTATKTTLTDLDMFEFRYVQISVSGDFDI